MLASYFCSAFHDPSFPGSKFSEPKNFKNFIQNIGFLPARAARASWETTQEFFNISQDSPFHFFHVRSFNFHSDGLFHVFPGFRYIPGLPIRFLEGRDGKLVPPTAEWTPTRPRSPFSRVLMQAVPAAAVGVPLWRWWGSNEVLGTSGSNYPKQFTLEVRFQGISAGTREKMEKKNAHNVEICLTISVKNKTWLRSWSRSLRLAITVSGSQFWESSVWPQAKQAKQTHSNIEADRPLNLEETTEERKVNNLVSKKQIKNAKKMVQKTHGFIGKTPLEILEVPLILF